MQDYDATLKLLLRRAGNLTIAMLSNVHVDKWLDIELPKTQNLRMDLLGEDASGNLYHFELQSHNDASIDLRMAEYALGTRRLLGRFPLQMVLYVGAAPMTMPSELRSPGLSLQYRVVDIRDLNGAELLSSADVGDNVVAVLTRLSDQKETVRAILTKIVALPENERPAAMQQLLILAGLRGLTRMVQEEVKKMPLGIDIMENEVIGPAIREGMARGLQQGMERGLQQGMEQGMERGLQQGMEQGMERGRQQEGLRFLRLHIEKRFGSIPASFDTKLAGLSVDEIELLANRVFDASSITDLLT